jgi:hypothetical protein
MHITSEVFAERIAFSFIRFSGPNEMCVIADATVLF